MMPAEPNVVVAGGGPAGAFAALLLARAGIDTTLLERARFPRRKVCGEYLNLGTLAVLDEHGLAAGVRARGRRLRGMALASGTSGVVDLPFPADACGLARAEFDAYLLDAARAAGVAVAHAGVVDVLRGDDGRVRGLLARDATGEVRSFPARFVVGADGCGSIVARKLGLAAPVRGTPKYAVGGHYTVAGLRDRVEMYVGREGYAAVNPLDDARANVMLVTTRDVIAGFGGDVDGGAAELSARLSGGRLRIRPQDRIGARVAVGPLQFRVSHPHVPGAVLVGDAAGFLNPFTGQGVLLALRGASGAALAVREALARPEHEAAIFARYALVQRADRTVRALLTSAIDLLAHAPALAPRVIERLARRRYVREALTSALSGATPPARALSPFILAGLLA